MKFFRISTFRIPVVRSCCRITMKWIFRKLSINTKLYNFWHFNILSRIYTDTHSATSFGQIQTQNVKIFCECKRIDLEKLISGDPSLRNWEQCVEEEVNLLCGVWRRDRDVLLSILAGWTNKSPDLTIQFPLTAN